MRALLILLGIMLAAIWLEVGYIAQGPVLVIAQLICLAVILLICVAL